MKMVELFVAFIYASISFIYCYTFQYKVNKKINKEIGNHKKNWIQS